VINYAATIYQMQGLTWHGRCQREPCRTIKFFRELKKKFPEVLATDETRMKN
jgi:hypothetical protein